MNTGLRSQPAVGIVTVHPNGGTLDTRNFARRCFDHLGREIVFFGPAQVHPQDHFRPVLRFRATGAGLDVQECAVRIEVAAEHALEFEALYALFAAVQVIVDLSYGVRIVFFDRHLKQFGTVCKPAGKFIE